MDKTKELFILCPEDHHTKPKEKYHKALVGYRVACPWKIENEKTCGKNAYVVRNDSDIWWIKMLQKLEDYEIKDAGLKKLIQIFPLFFRDNRVKLVLSKLLFVLFIAGSLFFYQFVSLLSKFTLLIPIISIFLAFIVIDTILVMISDAFVTRLQRNLFRSFMLWLINYLQIIITFGCFYYFSINNINKKILDYIYFSFATITTLGDATIQPYGWQRIIVALEVTIGFLLVVGILGIFISDFNRIPQYRLTVEALNEENRKLK